MSACIWHCPPGCEEWGGEHRRTVPEGCTHYCETGHFDGDDMTMLDIAAHARGVAEEQARWERSIGNVRGWLKAAQGYLVDARANTAPDRDIVGADRCIDAALDRIADLQHPPSGTQDGPGAPEAV